MYVALRLRNVETITYSDNGAFSVVLQLTHVYELCISVHSSDTAFSETCTGLLLSRFLCENRESLRGIFVKVKK